MVNKSNYCIYTDKYYDKLSKEHIIPSSLGGCNKFCVYTEEKINNDIGSKIEGHFETKDILGSFFRLAIDNKGHSGKEYIAKFRSHDNKRTLKFHENNNIEVFDNIMRKPMEIPNDDSFKGTLYKDLHIGLMAKIALGTGYYLFEDKFAKYADCNTLREVMNAVINEQEILNTDFKVNLSYLCRNNTIEFIESIFKVLESSGVIVDLCDNYIYFYIGINGRYLGTIAVRCDINKIVSQNPYNVLIVCKNKNVIRKDNALTLISSSICKNKFMPFNATEQNKEIMNKILDIKD